MPSNQNDLQARFEAQKNEPRPTRQTEDSPSREVRSLGTRVTERRCTNIYCSDFDEPHLIEVQGEECVQYLPDEKGNPTGTVERAWRMWTAVNDENTICETCDRQVGFVSPEGQDCLAGTTPTHGVRNNKEARAKRLAAQGVDPQAQEANRLQAEANRQQAELIALLAKGQK